MGNPESGRGRLRELFITKFKSQFKWGFAKVVVTRAGRLQEWSQGELRLYNVFNFLSLGVDRDECQDPSTNDCDKNAICENNVGSFECSCKKGFTGNGKTCQGNNYNKLKIYF